MQRVEGLPQEGLIGFIEWGDCWHRESSVKASKIPLSPESQRVPWRARLWCGTSCSGVMRLAAGGWGGTFCGIQGFESRGIHCGIFGRRGAPEAAAEGRAAAEVVPTRT